MMDDDTAAGAAEPGKTTAEANDTSAQRTGSSGPDKDPVVEALLGRPFGGNGPLPLIGDHKFKASLRKLADYAEDERLMLSGGILNALDPGPRRKFYGEVAHELGALLIEALTEAGQGSSAQRIQKTIKTALIPGKRGRKDTWTFENRSRVIVDLLWQILKNPKLSATEAWKKVAEDRFWQEHAARMGSKGPIYRHVQEGAKGIGKDVGRTMFKDAADMTRTINKWREKARTDPDWRKDQMEQARRIRANNGDANSGAN